MSFFSKIGSFFKSIFDRARPGLEQFLQSQQGQMIVTVVRNYVLSAADTKFNDYKPAVFNTVKQIVGDKVPDNWISIAIDFAYEQIKAEALKQADRLNRVAPIVEEQ